MNKKFKCPMMYGTPMMYGMEPMYTEPETPMVEGTEIENYYEDEEDDRQFLKMYPESCMRIMVYVNVEIDRMEKKDEMMHDEQPDREMVDMMADNAYNAMVKEIPDMAEEEEARQYPRRRFSRDLLRLLLLNELFRRRRRRRRRHYDYDYNDYY